MPPRWRFSGSVTACTITTSDSAAPEIHILVPFNTQCLPSFTARVCIMPPGSEPALASVWAKQVVLVPSITGWRKRATWSPLHSYRMLGTLAKGNGTAVYMNSSRIAMRASIDRSEPPYCAGTIRYHRPVSRDILISRSTSSGLNTERRLIVSFRP